MKNRVLKFIITNNIIYTAVIFVYRDGLFPLFSKRSFFKNDEEKTKNETFVFKNDYLLKKCSFFKNDRFQN